MTPHIEDADRGALLRELLRVKIAFQTRALCTAMGIHPGDYPHPVDHPTQYVPDPFRVPDCPSVHGGRNASE